MQPYEQCPREFPEENNVLQFYLFDWRDSLIQICLGTFNCITDFLLVTHSFVCTTSTIIARPGVCSVIIAVF